MARYYNIFNGWLVILVLNTLEVNIRWTETQALVETQQNTVILFQSTKPYAEQFLKNTLNIECLDLYRYMVVGHVTL